MKIGKNDLKEFLLSLLKDHKLIKTSPVVVAKLKAKPFSNQIRRQIGLGSSLGAGKNVEVPGPSGRMKPKVRLYPLTWQ